MLGKMSETCFWLDSVSPAEDNIYQLGFIYPQISLSLSLLKIKRKKENWKMADDDEEKETEKLSSWPL